MVRKRVEALAEGGKCGILRAFALFGPQAQSRKRCGVGLHRQCTLHALYMVARVPGVAQEYSRENGD